MTSQNTPLNSATPEQTAGTIDPVSEEIAQAKTPPGMVWIPGGTFRMGSADFYPEERPVHEVTVDGFWIDRCQVTNDQFAQFITETGFVTVAAVQPDAVTLADDKMAFAH